MFLISFWPGSLITILVCVPSQMNTFLLPLSTFSLSFHDASTPLHQLTAHIKVTQVRQFLSSLLG